MLGWGCRLPGAEAVRVNPAPRAVAADSAALARAAGSVLARLMPGIGRHRVEVRPPATAFDSAVAVLLRDTPEASLPVVEGYSGWIRTRGFTLRGDTAVVLVDWGASRPPAADGLSVYEASYALYFVPEGAVWRYARGRELSVADGGVVRDGP